MTGVELAEMFGENRRANAIDAEWDVRPDEASFRERAARDPALAAELATFLATSSAEAARYVLWLALPSVRDADLPALAAATATIADPDARLLAVFLLLGRARSAPPWWVEAAAKTLEATSNRTSRNLEAFRENVRKAVEEPARFSLQAGYAAGARLFNAGRFFDAHDAWEDVWRPNRDAERDFYRGLITLAVAMNKSVEGNENGVARLLERADALLAPFAPAHRGVDVAALRAAIATARTQAAAWAAGTRDGIDVRFQLPE